MATRLVPARTAAVSDDLTVPGDRRVLLYRRNEFRETYVHEDAPTAPARRSITDVVASIAMTLRQYAEKRAYLRSMGYSREVARRKALWHVR